MKERSGNKVTWRRGVALFFCAYTLAFGWSFLRSLLQFEFGDAILALLMGAVFFITGCIELNWFELSTWIKTEFTSIPGFRRGGWKASMSFFLLGVILVAILGGMIGTTPSPSESSTQSKVDAEGTSEPVTTNPYEANDEDDDSVYIQDTATHYDDYDDDSASAGCGSNDGDPGYDEDNDRDNDGICDEG